MADLKLDQIRKSYGAVDVLHGIDLDVEDGEFVVFVGPSGCGKSTLLRLTGMWSTPKARVIAGLPWCFSPMRFIRI